MRKAAIISSLAMMPIVLAILWSYNAKDTISDVGDGSNIGNYFQGDEKKIIIGSDHVTAGESAALPANKRDLLANNLDQRNPKPARMPSPSHKKFSPQTQEDVSVINSYALLIESPEARFRNSNIDQNTRIESEIADPNWAPYVETQLRHAIAQSQDKASRIRVSDAICKQTICMLTGIHDPPLESHNADWNSIIENAASSAWWSESINDVTTNVKVVDGKMVYITYFERYEMSPLPPSH